MEGTILKKINFSKSLDKFLTIDFNVDTIEQLFTLLQNKVIIQNTSYLLDNLMELSSLYLEGNKNVNAHIFLTSVIVHKYPEEILNNHPISKTIYQLSNDIMDILYGNNISNTIFLLKLWKKIQSYTEYFNKWKKTDCDYIVKQLIYTYLELGEVSNDINNNTQGNYSENTQYILDQVKQQQKDIKKKILKFNPKTGLELLNKHIENHKNMYQNMKEIMEKSYWELFEKDLSNKNYKPIVSILGDITNIITNLLPNRNDLLDELAENIDIKLIEQMIENDAIDEKYIYKMVKYIIKWCVNLDSSDNDTYYQNVNEQIDNFFKLGFDYQDFFPWFFKSIFQKLEDITIRVTKFRNSELYKKLIASKKKDD